MKWVKPEPALFALFQEVVPKYSDVEQRKMFGYPCAFVNNNMFMGGHGALDLLLRLDGADRNTFLHIRGTRQFEPTPGRIMREYIVIPPEWHQSLHHPELREWIEKSYGYVKKLPPKINKPRTTAKE